ncbi:MAG: T9SS type A sorting domain-containing protein [Chitinophagales bacterium]|nr:T9SS type A sorting domain-containing protein [Chitinophagales bacterium]MDW8418508.1 T9SS type A sorting domain-containing protein [Chitinophagales bacterium]
MKKHLLFSLLSLLGISLLAQPVRYLDEIFQNVKVDSNVVYGKNKSYLSGFNAVQNLVMDVYQPVGDTATNRPVIILMHAGSFLPPSVTGFTFADKNENCIVELCKRFAKRGFVAVSMAYRLGWNPTAPTQEERSKTIINAVYRAMQDVRGCVRYFRSTYADSSNKWGIDPNKFILGGSNSGAYVALAASYFNRPIELYLPKFLDGNGIPFVDTTLTGNFEGFGGTQNLDNFPGYSSAFNCVLSLGGAVADTTLIEPGETAIIAFQGQEEQLTPYNTATVITTTLQPVIEVSGSGDFMPVVVKIGNNNGFTPNSFPPGPPNKQGGVYTQPVDGLYPFKGEGFEPWNWYNGGNPAINPTASEAKAKRYIDTIMAYSIPRLYRLLIDPNYGNPTQGLYKSDFVECNVYPNPAADVLNVFVNSLQQPIERITVYDLHGKVVKEHPAFGGHHEVVPVADISNGTYIVKVTLQDNLTATKLINVY